MVNWYFNHKIKVSGDEVKRNFETYTCVNLTFETSSQDFSWLFVSHVFARLVKSLNFMAINVETSRNLITYCVWIWRLLMSKRCKMFKVKGLTLESEGNPFSFKLI